MSNASECHAWWGAPLPSLVRVLLVPPCLPHSFIFFQALQGLDLQAFCLCVRTGSPHTQHQESHSPDGLIQGEKAPSQHMAGSRML